MERLNAGESRQRVENIHVQSILFTAAYRFNEPSRKRASSEVEIRPTTSPTTPIS